MASMTPEEVIMASKDVDLGFVCTILLPYWDWRFLFGQLFQPCLHVFVRTREDIISSLSYRSWNSSPIQHAIQAPNVSIL